MKKIIIIFISLLVINSFFAFQYIASEPEVSTNSQTLSLDDQTKLKMRQSYINSGNPIPLEYQLKGIDGVTLEEITRRTK